MAKVEISIELLRKLKDNNSYSEKLIVEEFPYLFKKSIQVDERLLDTDKVFTEEVISKSDFKKSIEQENRILFALSALKGILSNPNCNPTQYIHFKNITDDAINLADLMLKKLKEYDN